MFQAPRIFALAAEFIFVERKPLRLLAVLPNRFDIEQQQQPANSLGIFVVIPLGIIFALLQTNTVLDKFVEPRRKFFLAFVLRRRVNFGKSFVAGGNQIADLVIKFVIVSPVFEQQKIPNDFFPDII